MLKDNTRRILGKLFKKYREDQNISIIEIEHANISSTKTLYNAFNGETIVNDNFYIDYCEFYNHPYKFVDDIETWLSNFIIRVIHAFDYFEEAKFDILYEEFLNKFNGYEENAIYREYYQVIKSLFNYYRKNEYLRLEEVEDYFDLIDIELFSKELNLYLLDYMFRSNWNYIRNNELVTTIVKKMESIDGSHYLTRYQAGYYNMIKFNFIYALNDFNQCVEISKDRNNRYRELQSLLAIYAVYRNIDSSMQEEIANKLIELKDENVSNTIIQNINYTIGMNDYLEEKYERAYKLFNENITQYKSYMPLLFQCSICSRLNIEYPSILFSKEIENGYDFIYLDYFRQKYLQVDSVKLAKYVLNVIIPTRLKENIYKNPYWSLFEYEMLEMANKDIKIRKYYVNYMKEVKKYCKDA